ncbi:MAG: tetratricopeptide repeat protein [Planctomycetota bacterium]|jgi:hypothetical protein
MSQTVLENLIPSAARLALLGGIGLAFAPTVEALSPVAAPATAPTLAATASTASVVQANRPDQVFEQSRRSVRPVSGRVISNGLEGVVIETDGRERTIEAANVVRVQLNQVPAAYRDGIKLAAGGDHTAAATSFQSAAEDRDASEPAKAAARHRAASALLEGTATDPGRAKLAVLEAERFLADHPDNREVPEVQLLLGRAQWLAGDAASAASTFEGLFRQASGETATTGYRIELCYEAGLLGAHAALAAGDSAKAQELLAGLESNLPGVIGALEADDARVPALEALRARAQLGEGHVLLAGGKAAQARSFFQARLDAGEVASERSAAQVGLALALELEGSAREAQLLFAQVTATAVDSGDVVAAALVGLARTSLAAGDSGARDLARTWLEEVRDRHGASLSAREAHEALSAL